MNDDSFSFLKDLPEEFHSRWFVGTRTKAQDVPGGLKGSWGT